MRDQLIGIEDILDVPVSVSLGVGAHSDHNVAERIIEMVSGVIAKEEIGQWWVFDEPGDEHDMSAVIALVADYVSGDDFAEPTGGDTICVFQELNKPLGARPGPAVFTSPGIKPNGPACPEDQGCAVPPTSRSSRCASCS